MASDLLRQRRALEAHVGEGGAPVQRDAARVLEPPAAAHAQLGAPGELRVLRARATARARPGRARPRGRSAPRGSAKRLTASCARSGCPATRARRSSTADLVGDEARGEGEPVHARRGARVAERAVRHGERAGERGERARGRCARRRAGRRPRARRRGCRSGRARRPRPGSRARRPGPGPRPSRAGRAWPAGPGPRPCPRASRRARPKPSASRSSSSVRFAPSKRPSCSTVQTSFASDWFELGGPARRERPERDAREARAALRGEARAARRPTARAACRGRGRCAASRPGRPPATRPRGRRTSAPRGPWAGRGRRRPGGRRGGEQAVEVRGAVRPQHQVQGRLLEREAAHHEAPRRAAGARRGPGRASPPSRPRPGRSRPARPARSRGPRAAPAATGAPTRRRGAPRAAASSPAAPRTSASTRSCGSSTASAIQAAATRTATTASTMPNTRIAARAKAERAFMDGSPRRVERGPGRGPRGSGVLGVRCRADYTMRRPRRGAPRPARVEPARARAEEDSPGTRRRSPACAHRRARSRCCSRWRCFPPRAAAPARASTEEFSSFDVERPEEDDESVLDHLLARPPAEWRDEWERAPQAFRTSQGCFTSGQWYTDNAAQARVPARPPRALRPAARPGRERPGRLREPRPVVPVPAARGHAGRDVPALLRQVAPGLRAHAGSWAPTPPAIS